MELMEITEKERVSREDAVARPHALAKRNAAEFGVDEGAFKLEIKVEEHQRELEIELKW